MAQHRLAVPLWVRTGYRGRLSPYWGRASRPWLLVVRFEKCWSSHWSYGDCDWNDVRLSLCDLYGLCDRLWTVVSSWTRQLLSSPRRHLPILSHYLHPSSAPTSHRDRRQGVAFLHSLLAFVSSCWWMCGRKSWLESSKNVQHKQKVETSQSSARVTHAPWTLGATTLNCNARQLFSHSVFAKVPRPRNKLVTF